MVMRSAVLPKEMQSLPELPVAYAAVPIGMNALEGAVRFSELPRQRASRFPAPRLDPLCYPGVRPESSFTTGSGNVLPLRVLETTEGPVFGIATAEGVHDLDDWLRKRNVATMDERVPIVGFGSNACPGQLCEKFSRPQNKWGDITVPGDHHIVPTLKGTVQDVAAAYSSRLGIHGYVFAELVEAQGAETEVFVNFLSPGQLKRMIRSEAQYELCDLGKVTIDGLQRPIPAYGFVGKNEVLLDAAGKPILLKDVPSHGAPYASMDQSGVLTMLAHEFGPALDTAYPHAPVYADTAANLMAYSSSSYRQEFVRKPDTSTIIYKNHPAAGEEPEQLPGMTLQALLRDAGRVSNDLLLGHLSAEQRNITPRSFGELYKHNV